MKSVGVHAFTVQKGMGGGAEMVLNVVCKKKELEPLDNDQVFENFMANVH